jgi:hypothetical protein
VEILIEVTSHKCHRCKCVHGSGNQLCLKHCGNGDCERCTFRSYEEIDKQFKWIAQLRSCLLKKLPTVEDDKLSTYRLIFMDNFPGLKVEREEFELYDLLRLSRNK